MRKQRRQERSGYVRPNELCTPATFVVEADLVAVRPELRGHFQRHRAEADRFARMLALSPTLLKLLVLMAPVRGTASPGTDSGRGLQCPRRRLSDVLCAAQSAISDAIALGVEEGLLERYAPTRSVAAITARRPEAERLTHSLVKAEVGQRQGRTKMNVHGVLYLTARGAELVANLGVLSTFVRGQSGRRRVRTGLVGNVSKTLSNPLRTVALRCTAAVRRRTPKDSTNPSSSDQPASGRTTAAAARPTGLPDAHSADVQLLETLTAPSGPDGKRSHRLRGELDEAADCYARGIGSADHWRPDAWRAATVAGRQHLVAKFQPLAELVTLLEQHRGPMRRQGSTPAAAEPKIFDKHTPRADSWWSGYGSNAHLDALARDRKRGGR